MSQGGRASTRQSAGVLIGLAHEDAKADFARLRRRQRAARLGSRLRRSGCPTLPVLPAPSVGRGRDAGVEAIPVVTVVGTVDHPRTDFDPAFRPASGRTRARWERLAAARRRGDALPPIDVVRVDGEHYVVDGHHRVSVARAFGDSHVEARVRELR